MPRNEPTHDGVVYRRAEGTADKRAFARILERSFGLPPDSSRVAWKRLGEDIRMLEVAGEAAATLSWYAFGQWFGGRTVRCAGIAAVGVEPHLRGSGLASKIVAEALIETAEQGFALAALYPSSLPLYRGVDFEVAGARYVLKAPCASFPRAKGLESLTPLPDGVRDRRVRALHRHCAAHHDGWIDRNEALWDRVREFRGEHREGFGVLRGDELAGHVFLARRRRRELGFDLVVGDLCATDGAAARAILSFLASHGTIALDVHLFVAPWDPVCALLDGPPGRHALHHPWMLRVLDLPSALAARGFARDLDTEIEIEVEDRLLAHNHGRFLVRVADGVARVERGGSGRIRVATRALGPWFSGFQSAEALAMRGLVAGRPEDLAAMSSLTAGRGPWTSDFF